MAHLLKFVGILLIVFVVWAGVDLLLFQPLGFNSTVWNIVHFAGDVLSGIISFVQRLFDCMMQGCAPPS